MIRWIWRLSWYAIALMCLGGMLSELVIGPTLAGVMWSTVAIFTLLALLAVAMAHVGGDE